MKISGTSPSLSLLDDLLELDFLGTGNSSDGSDGDGGDELHVEKCMRRGGVRVGELRYVGLGGERWDSMKKRNEKVK